MTTVAHPTDGRAAVPGVSGPAGTLAGMTSVTPERPSLADVAPAFVEIAHRIVWASVATVDERGRPWTRVLHPLWEWDGTALTGWVATSATPAKVRHLGAHPNVAVSYWDPSQDTLYAHCAAALHTDEASRHRVWEAFKTAPEPVGYDPAIVPPWSGGPDTPGFAALRLDPWRLTVQPGAVLLQGRGDLARTWAAP